jgi:hypothetical protein
MVGRLAIAGTIVSLVGLVACLVLAMASPSVGDTRVHRLSLSRGFYISVVNWGADVLWEVTRYIRVGTAVRTFPAHRPAQGVEVAEILK